MAWKRSTVRTRPGPPEFLPDIIRATFRSEAGPAVLYTRVSGASMPLRELVADKHGLTRKGFNFIGTNGTVESTVGKTRYHISVHGEGAPVKWDRFHVKIYDLRF